MKRLITIEPYRDDTYSVAGDMTICIPLTLEQYHETKITVVHTGFTQDHSIKCWFSTEPDNAPVDPHLFTSYWHPNRDVSEYAVVHDHTIEPTIQGGWVTGRAPGQYYLNVQNLVNAPNEFVVIADNSDLMPVIV